MSATSPHTDPLTIAGKTYHSRLMVGTGKYASLQETQHAIEASGAEIITVAIRRTNIGQSPDEPNLLDVVSPQKYTLLPNTAGCYTAQDAVRTLRLARELLTGHDLFNIEVIGDANSLFPKMLECLKDAKQLDGECIKFMVYCADDQVQCKMLEDNGCVAIMPLASLIVSGLGI